MSPPKSEPLTLPKGWTVETQAPSQPLMLPEGFTVEPQTLREAWKSAEKDPVRRTELVKDIAKAYAEEAYGAQEGDKRLLGGAGQAFSDTGQNFLGIGMKRRDIRKTGQRTFGMTDDEARLLADEVDRLKMEMRPLSTFAGGVTGGVGFAGSLGRFGRAVAAGPGVIGQLGRLMQIGTGPGTMLPNVARGSTAAAANLAATEGYGQERLPTLGQTAFAATSGGLIPAGFQALGNYFARGANPTAEAGRIIGRDVGRAGAQQAEEFAQATGEAIPVGSAVLDRSQAGRIVDSMPDVRQAGTQLERSAEVGMDLISEGARRNLMQNLPATPGRLAPDQPNEPDFFLREATRYSNEFMGAAEAVPLKFTQYERNVLAERFQKLADEPLTPDRALFEDTAEAFRKGTITARQAEGARVNLKNWSETATKGGGRDKYKTDLGVLIDALERNIPGYKDDYLANHSALMQRAKEAAEGARVL